eukprot:jgi/Bigna1/87512/estExt_fgenesh1_pg.C_210082
MCKFRAISIVLEVGMKEGLCFSMTSGRIRVFQKVRRRFSEEKERHAQNFEKGENTRPGLDVEPRRYKFPTFTVENESFRIGTHCSSRYPVESRRNEIRLWEGGRTNNAAKVPYYYSPLRTASLRAFDASSNHRLSTVVKVPLLPSKIGHRLSLANIRAFGDHPAESHPHNEEEEEEDDEGFDLGFHEVGADFEFEDEEVLGDTANKMEQDGRIEAELPVEETPLFKFKQLGLKGPLLRAVESLGYTEPSPIQQAAIPLILNRESIIAAAQTGTGKTMAYMAPLAQLLKNDEAKRKETQTRSSRPKALILVPNRELALQAMGLAKTLSHEVKLSSALITGGGQRSQENKRCKRDIDLLVATPGRARQLFLEERRLFFSELKYVVIDEADTMFDPRNGFGQEMESLLVPIENSAKFAAGKKKLQFILVTASLKGRIAEGIQKRLPGLKRAQTKDFQQQYPSKRWGQTSRLLDTSRLSLRMVDASRRDKQVVLAEVLNSAKESMGGSTVVFCNTIDSARATDLYLKEAG